MLCLRYLTFASIVSWEMDLKPSVYVHSTCDVPWVAFGAGDILLIQPYDLFSASLEIWEIWAI